MGQVTQRLRKKPSPRFWVALAVAVLLAAGVCAAWRWTPLRDVLTPEGLSRWAQPYRESWAGIVLTVGVFVVAEFLLFPVLLLILFTGMAFGPWLGSVYALAGCLASAAASHGVGRRLGQERLERWGGRRVRELSKRLGSNGIMAVFMARKVPAPYTLVNLIAGASRIRFGDFMIGTLLGMGTGVVAVSVFGSQLGTLFEKPSLALIGLALGLFFLPLLVAYVIQRRARHRKAVAA